MRASEMSVSGRWTAPHEHPALAATDAHVWLARAEAGADSEGTLFATLDASERERARRFHFARDRERYVMAHGLLRRLLARYTGERPERLAFGEGPYGKPHLLERGARMGLEFNMSHSGDLVLVAVAQSRAVGVDVERWDAAAGYDAVAAFCFSQSERAMLRAASGAAKTAAFFALWTRKEAYIKATGCGVSQGLDHFDVSLTPGAARLLCDRRDPGAAERWSVYDLAPGPGYSGAVIVEGASGRLRCFSLAQPAESGDL